MFFPFLVFSFRTIISLAALCVALAATEEAASAETQAGLTKRTAPEQQTLLPARERIPQEQLRSSPQSQPRLEDPRSINPAPQPNELRSVQGVEQEHDPNDIGHLLKLGVGIGPSNKTGGDRLMTPPPIGSDKRILTVHPSSEEGADTGVLRSIDQLADKMIDPAPP